MGDLAGGKGRDGMYMVGRARGEDARGMKSKVEPGGGEGKGSAFAFAYAYICASIASSQSEI